jgi:glycosyltransferase involved in cell wall biosynthesis
MHRTNVILNWQIDCDFGWGILGLNIFFQWANDRAIKPIGGKPIGNNQLRLVDPLRLSVVAKAIGDSNQFLENIESGTKIITHVDAVVIEPISHGLSASTLYGNANVGRCIFESSNIADFQDELSKFDVLLCGSNWNADILRSRTVQPVEVIFEGIDPSLFFPGPRSGLLDPTIFYVFSGGKVEFRKGQDLVLLAFKEFARRHADTILVTAWHSPWPQISHGFRGRLDAALELDVTGRLNIKKWADDNGIDPTRVIEIFSTPNQVMPLILREMDVAIQPSRAEACTNLPVKEAMACGLPVIVGNNTGMKDLITGDNCIPLLKQAPVASIGDYHTEGWGESDVDEIVEALETMYADKARRLSVGSAAAHWVHSNRTWQTHARRLKELILSLR